MKKIDFTSEKFWNLVGTGLGLLVIIVGLIFMFTPAEHYYTSSTDYAAFGADFYTYQYDATRAAASNAAVTANNLRELGHKLATYAGTFFMIMGALISLNYGKKLALCCAAAPAEVSAEIPAEIDELPELEVAPENE